MPIKFSFDEHEDREEFNDLQHQIEALRPAEFVLVELDPSPTVLEMEDFIVADDEAISRIKDVDSSAAKYWRGS